MHAARRLARQLAHVFENTFDCLHGVCQPRALACTACLTTEAGELKRTLQSLACGKVRVITKEPKVRGNSQAALQAYDPQVPLDALTFVGLPACCTLVGSPPPPSPPSDTRQALDSDPSSVGLSEVSCCPPVIACSVWAGSGRGRHGLLLLQQGVQGKADAAEDQQHSGQGNGTQAHCPLPAVASTS